MFIYTASHVTHLPPVLLKGVAADGDGWLLGSKMMKRIKVSKLLKLKCRMMH